MMAKVLYCASVWVHLKNFHLPYIREMEDAGWEVHLMASGIPDNTGFLHTHDLPVKKSILSPRNLQAVLRIARLIRREQFDLIYVHTTLAAFLCRIALMLFPVPRIRLIYVCHGYFFSTDKYGRVKKHLGSLFYLLCEKMLAKLTPVLVLMNEEDYASAIRYRLGADIRFSHGLGLVPDHYTLPAEKKADGDKTVFLCVGELSARKNQELLLRAFAQARKSMPCSMLWLAGDGSERRRCEELAEKLGLTGHVQFLGHVQDVSGLYVGADVLVSTSRCEGLPFCIMEGLHFGLPVIATNIKRHRDLIKHGHNGMLYDMQDESELAGYMTWLGISREERGRLSAQAELPEEYLIEAAMEEFRQLIGLPDTVRILETADAS